jgi:hypothetical protein
MKPYKVTHLTENRLVTLLGNDGVAKLEQTYDVDLSEGAVFVTLAGGKPARIAEIDSALRLSEAKESLPMLIAASSFEPAAQDWALEFEDVVLCTRKGGKLTPLIPA